ncbi:MAG: valine--pyruvate transaminase [Thermodesulfobacteriota bacterium]
MKLSLFGEKFSEGAGILSLMDDLGNALASGSDNLIMMGGGNPGHVTPFSEVVRQRLSRISNDPEQFHRLVGIYDPPQGDKDFLKALAGMLRREFGWDLSEENICLTNGSQAGFFILFNMFAGSCSDGSHKKIRLPLAPEYIGYSDLGLDDDFFISSKPKIEHLSDNQFKYHVDFSAMNPGEETGAICVSRPTNPTGNVITDEELGGLDQMASRLGVPLIIDNAYGLPFPGIVYCDASPIWNENIILCLSLSKLGLPAVRTGIIVAAPEIIKAVSGVNSVMNLATGSFGAVLAQEMVDSGQILNHSREMIRPFYEEKMKRAVEHFNRELQGVPYHIHKPEGAMFLWIWFEDLPITSLELYNRLKSRDVLVVSGHYFFPGLEENWPHKNQCIRVTYSQDDSMVAKGIKLIGEEVRKVYDQNC